MEHICNKEHDLGILKAEVDNMKRELIKTESKLDKFYEISVSVGKMGMTLDGILEHNKTQKDINEKMLKAVSEVGEGIRSSNTEMSIIKDELKELKNNYNNIDNNTKIVISASNLIPFIKKNWVKIILALGTVGGYLTISKDFL